MYVRLTLPERMRDLREEKGLTLEQLAERTGISRSALQTYESNEDKEISPSSIATLAQFYGVSTLYLMGLSENKNAPDMDIQDLRLDDKTLAFLRDGKFNRRLLCELIAHEGFPRLLTDIEVVVDRIADMRVGQMNASFEAARQEVIRRYAPDKDDVHMRTLELAQIPEDDFFRHVVHEDIDRIVRDIREARRDDTTTADERPQPGSVLKEFQGIIQSGVSGAEAFIKVFCRMMEIPFEKLTSEEFTAFLKILSKSKKVKKQQSMRGKSGKGGQMAAFKKKRK